MNEQALTVRFIIRDEDAEPASPIGGKGRALATLRQAGLPIPRWIAVTAYRDTATSDAEPCAAGLAELESALRELCPGGEPVAVRSSAEDEDSRQHSFAGQLDSFLGVPPEQVAGKVAAVWRSAFGSRVASYRRQQGLQPPTPPAVLVQRLVKADVAGVAFGADPVSGRRGVSVICAVYGLGSGLVEGQANADTYHVDRDGRIVQRLIVDKALAQRFDPDAAGGVRPVPVRDEMRQRPALSDEQVCRVAELVRQAGKVFGRPQDIEWAFEGGCLYLLQSRAITGLADLADPDGALNLWDNSNIAESYNGVTTPLTFSFARRAYEGVYREFCRLLCVPEAKLKKNDDVFRQMLGLIRGRVYYNLLSWYRALALLPGFTFNRRFMEQMMGVKEGLPESIAAGLTQASRWERCQDALYLLRSLAALVLSHFTLNRRVRRFCRRLDQALGTTRPELDRWSADELAAYYRDVERQLLPHWDAPLVNDFLAMIFHGLLRRLSERWCGDSGGALANDLLSSQGGVISAEPALRIRQMAETARRDPGLMDLLCEGTRIDIDAALQRWPVFRELYQAYLDRFGDRCLEELKLESPTLHDDPLMLLRAVGSLARRPAVTPPGEDSGRRIHAVQQVRAALRWRPLRRLLFVWVLRNTRARLRDRENLRFERTRLFGRARQIFVELGKRFFALNALDQPRDVFYMEVGEVLGYIDGTATCTDLKGLAALRQAEFERYRHMEPPADRFETRGPVHRGNSFRGKAVPSRPTGEVRQGQGCGPGVVCGPARLVLDPRATVVQPGDILVAQRTDPGWITLFASAAGLVVERGSPLSHSAIVARELGLPMVVALDAVTSWLSDGDWVEVDARHGTVTRIATNGKPAPARQ